MTQGQGQGSWDQHTLSCEQCGAGLPLPADAYAPNVTCPYCHHTTVIAQEVVQARVQHFQHAQHVAREQRAEAYEATLAKGQWWRKALMVAAPLAGAVVLFAGMAGWVLGNRYGWFSAAEEHLGDATGQARPGASGPDGSTEVRDQINVLRGKGCGRLVMRPKQYAGEPAHFWIKRSRFGSCMHIVAVSGDPQAKLSLKFTASPGMTPKLPPPAREVDYRLCPQQDGTFVGSVESSTAEPFTMGVVRCDRKEGEGGIRSRPDDPATNGKQRTAAWLKQLVAAGCTSLSKRPEVLEGTQRWAVTIDDPRKCYSALFVSSFADVKLKVMFETPLGEALPAPVPGHEVRLVYCPKHRGTHGLAVMPSTPEHYTMATIDCPRGGPEGAAREQEMIGRAKQAGAVDQGPANP